MAAILNQPITDASAWTGAMMRQRDDWIYVLNADEIADVDQALKAVQAKGLAIDQITREDFPLPVLGGALAKLEDEVRSGRGFAIIRGIPVERYRDEEVYGITWGIGTYLGTAVSQNTYGDVLGHVFDHEYDTSATRRVRGYQTSDALMFHVDRCAITMLLCLRQAKAGGLSRIISSMTIHNEILARQPAHLEPLYDGVPYIHREAVGEMHSWMEPVYSVTDGVLSCSIRRNTVQQAIEESGLPVPQATRDALTCFDTIAEEPDLYLDMQMQPGDIQIVNNCTVLHARTAFVDHLEPDKKRHMVRLWLRFLTPRPMADYLQQQYAGVAKATERDV
jgi:hypothetical protein